MANIIFMNRWKLIVIVVLIAAAVAAGVAYHSMRTAIPSVQVIHPIRTGLYDYVTCNGKIEPVNAAVFHAPLDTFVTGVFSKEGRMVHRGETLLTLDASQVRANLAKAKIELLSADEGIQQAQAGGPPDEKAQLTADLRQAKVDLDRLQTRQDALEKFLESHASTKDEVSQNAAALARSRSLVETLQKKQEDFASRVALQGKSDQLRRQQAKETIQSLEQQLQSATVVSPFEGTLFSFPLRTGDYVKVGEELASIAELRKVRLRAYVDESDIGHLKLDQPVKITWDAMPDREWSGKTEQIPQQVEARGTRSVGEVLCSVDNSKLELLPNVNVDVRILVQASDHALVLPRGAVRSLQGRHYVFVLDGNRLSRRVVILGMANATSYDIVSGLAESDSVVLSGNSDLRDGLEVRTYETAP